MPKHATTEPQTASAASSAREDPAREEDAGPGGGGRRAKDSSVAGISGSSTDFSWTWNEKRKTAAAELAQASRKPWADGAATCCAIEGRAAATVAASATRTATDGPPSSSRHLSGPTDRTADRRIDGSTDRSVQWVDQSVTCQSRNKKSPDELAIDLLLPSYDDSELGRRYGANCTVNPQGKAGQKAGVDLSVRDRLTLPAMHP